MLTRLGTGPYIGDQACVFVILMSTGLGTRHSKVGDGKHLVFKC